jgi:hypothetical protein
MIHRPQNHAEDESGSDEKAHDALTLIAMVSVIAVPHSEYSLCNVFRIASSCDALSASMVMM